MIRHTGCHRLRFPLVAPSHLVMLSRRRQNLGHPIPVGLTDTNGSRHSLSRLYVFSAAALDFGTASHAPEPLKSRCTFRSAPYSRGSHRCVSSQPPPVRKWGPYNVKMRDLHPNEEEMTPCCRRQQPPWARSDQRAPLQGETKVSGALQQVQAPPLWKNIPPPNLHHDIAESGTGCRPHAGC